MVVDGIGLRLVRFHSLGFCHIVVATLASKAYSSYITVASNYTACSSSSTLAYESSTHNALLARRMRLLKQELQSASFVIVDQTQRV
jgi:hypothetical protein